MSVDLTALPQITFLDADAAGVESRIITQYETVAGRSLAKGDPEEYVFLNGKTVKRKTVIKMIEVRKNTQQS